MGKLDDTLTKMFGCHTRAVENPVIITTGGATAVQVLLNNPDRMAAVIVNASANPEYIGLSDRVSATNGVLLAANGGSATIKWDDDFQMTGWAWWIISPAGDSAVYSIEVIGT